MRHKPPAQHAQPPIAFPTLSDRGDVVGGCDVKPLRHLLGHLVRFEEVLDRLSSNPEGETCAHASIVNATIVQRDRRRHLPPGGAKLVSRVERSSTNPSPSPFCDR